jgi:hypothetical protein
VKKEISVVFKFVAGFALIIVAFWSCKNDLNDLGKDILDKNDLVTVRKWVSPTGSIKAYTMTDEKLRTDEPPYTLLGSFNDPVFGKTSANYACQLRLRSFPKYKPTDIIDSLVYYVYYQEIYGDTLTPQKLRVYELSSDLDIKSKYYQDVNLKDMAYNNVLAELSYIPRHKDTLRSSTSTIRDTVVQEIAFHLNHTFARKLMAIDSTVLATAHKDSINDLFTKLFKGLYIEAGDIPSGGSILKTLGSGMMLYYRTSNKDTLRHWFEVTSNSANVSQFKHDYSGTAFAANLDKETAQDSLIYLQTTGGLRSKIYIPGLENWGDSTNFAINKAELIFQIDTTLTDVKKHLPQERLLLAAIGKSVVDRSDSIYYLSDYMFSPDYFGGVFRSTDKTYRFNITKHLQDIIDQKKGKENNGFYLESSVKNSIFRRTVLKGPTSKTGIRFEITYSKIN